ncbi:MAG: hypothetical protein LBC64_08100 [Fibromonadaceae bacterium]|jgi:hypothetical protein|nr:hypothetical protein [Fibromonadaceae bacterium]
MKNQPVNESNAGETVSESELEELRSVVKRILRILEGYIELNALGSKK